MTQAQAVVSLSWCGLHLAYISPTGSARNVCTSPSYRIPSPLGIASWLNASASPLATIPFVGIPNPRYSSWLSVFCAPRRRECSRERALLAREDEAPGAFRV